MAYYTQGPLYNRWRGIRQALYNPNSADYRWAGGRKPQPLTMDFETYKQFETYVLGKLGMPPGNDYKLHRINQELGWIKGNLKWAKPKELSNNIRQCIFIKYKNKTKSLKEWSQELGMSYHTVNSRYHKGWPPELIFSKKKYGYGRMPKL
jgi:hypothetical protein